MSHSRHAHPHLKQNVLKVPGRPRVCVDTTDEHILICVKVAIQLLKSSNNLGGPREAQVGVVSKTMHKADGKKSTPCVNAEYHINTRWLPCNGTVGCLLSTYSTRTIHICMYITHNR